MRVGKRGEGKWKRIGWDEALSFIADKLNAVKAEHGAEAVAKNCAGLKTNGAGGNYAGLGRY